MKQKLTIFFTILLLIILFSAHSLAVFTTGQGKHTFKINTFRVSPELQLQSFLVGFGISKNISVNFELENATDNSKKLNFIAPYYEQMKGSTSENGGLNKNNFYLTGPILNISAQYIPTQELFVTPDALNAVQVGIRNLRGESKDSLDARSIEDVDRTYLVMGLISRSRWETHNLFSDLHFIADIANNSWGMDTQLGYEYRFKDNIRFHLSYKYMATTSGAQNGISVGVKTHY